MSRPGHRQRLPCASLVTHLACTNTTFCSKISKYIVAAMKKDNFTKRAKPTVLGSTRSNFPRHCAPSLGNFHTGPNEDAGFAGQFRMQNCTRGRLVLESRCERIADRPPALELTKLLNGGKGCSRRKHGYRKESGSRALLAFPLPLALYARVLSKPG